MIFIFVSPFFMFVATHLPRSYAPKVREAYNDLFLVEPPSVAAAREADDGCFRTPHPRIAYTMKQLGRSLKPNQYIISTEAMVDRLMIECVVGVELDSLHTLTRLEELGLPFQSWQLSAHIVTLSGDEAVARHRPGVRAALRTIREQELMSQSFELPEIIELPSPRQPSFGALVLVLRAINALLWPDSVKITARQNKRLLLGYSPNVSTGMM